MCVWFGTRAQLNFGGGGVEVWIGVVMELWLMLCRRQKLHLQLQPAWLPQLLLQVLLWKWSASWKVTMFMGIAQWRQDGNSANCAELNLAAVRIDMLWGRPEMVQSVPSDSVYCMVFIMLCTGNGQ